MPATVDLGISGLEVRTGDHICAFYRGAERDDMLVSFLAAGLRSGDKCICVLDAARPESLLTLLDDPQGQERLERRQLEFIDSRDAHRASGGGFVPDRMLEFWEHNAQSALEGGAYRFFRAAGEMTWALRDMPGLDQLAIFESEVNRLMPRYPQVYLCVYDIERFSGEQVLDVLKTHPKVLISAMMFDNPYYVEPDEFLAQRQ